MMDTSMARDNIVLATVSADDCSVCDNLHFCMSYTLWHDWCSRIVPAMRCASQRRPDSRPMLNGVPRSSSLQARVHPAPVLLIQERVLAQRLSMMMKTSRRFQQALWLPTWNAGLTVFYEGLTMVLFVTCLAYVRYSMMQSISFTATIAHYLNKNKYVFFKIRDVYGPRQMKCHSWFSRLPLICNKNGKNMSNWSDISFDSGHTIQVGYRGLDSQSPM
jgi:hypothetical protein